MLPNQREIEKWKVIVATFMAAFALCVTADIDELLATDSVRCSLPPIDGTSPPPPPPPCLQRTRTINTAVVLLLFFQTSTKNNISQKNALLLSEKGGLAASSSTPNWKKERVLKALFRLLHFAREVLVLYFSFPQNILLRECLPC